MTGLISKMATSASAMAARLSPVRFARSEDGTITAFACMIFVLMVGASGIAIDVMRYETQRTQLQYTLDRAILAAASLSQPYDPEGVVRDYFSIAGIEGYRLDVRVDEGINFRRVHAYAELEVRSLFMQLFGVRVMSTPAIGAAEERVRNIEVSMVLDISGSMGENNRMTNMRPAAREFVTAVLSANQDVTHEQLVSVSIVPYNGMVNSGALIGSAFAFDNVHNASNCPRFLPEDFTSTAIDPTVAIRRIAHFDYNNRTNDQLFATAYCPTDQYGAILPWQSTEGPLHASINALGTEGFTAIDVGMRWAVALLDPAARPAVNTLIASGNVHPDFNERPAPFRDGDPATRLDDETIKVVVLMTDGANTNQYDIRDQYRTGYAPIFRHLGSNLSSPNDDRFSVWYPGRNQFWIPTGSPRDADGSWSNTPFGGWAAYGMLASNGQVVDTWPTLRQNAFQPTVDRNGDGAPDALAGTVLSWPSLWATYTAEYMAEEWFESPARSSNNWTYHDNVATNSSFQFAGRAAGDTNLRAICDAAQANGIIIFSIGFEAPEGGQEVMRHCASSDAHYYDVEGLEISEAFASIARTINQLRLIQ